MTELTLFASTFVLVMLLGMQSLNTNNGHYVAAFITSFGIGASNLVLFKLAPDANTTEMLAYLLGGPFGILAAMWLHPKLSLWIKRRECGKAFREAAKRGVTLKTVMRDTVADANSGMVPKPAPWPAPPQNPFQALGDAIADETHTCMRCGAVSTPEKRIPFVTEMVCVECQFPGYTSRLNINSGADRP